MATFTVRAGIHNTLTLANSQVVIIGRNKWLKCLKFNEKLQEKLANRVDKKTFEEAINLLEQSSRIPLFFNYAQIISVGNEVSRHNSPSNSIAIYRELKGLTAEPNSKNLCIVLYAEFAHILASVTAIARCFPIYTRKTATDVLAKRFANVDVEIVVTDEKTLADADVAYLQRIRESVSIVGRWIDMPCNELNSEAFAKEAIEFIDTIRGANIKRTLIKGNDLLQHGFGGIYHVGKAALSPPIFLCFSHTPHSATKTYALVGKGIVYDTGGMQIKMKTAMPNMKCDMGGAAAVVGTFYNLVSSGFTQNLHCILCIAENNISPAANKPDDIITLLSGKTVEINNTDAEGRLVLADGVFYAKEKLHADTIIDIATLTGAQHYASGKLHSSILTNDEQIERECVAAGRHCGELCHPMPFAPDLHFGDLKSSLADMKNAKLEMGAMNGPPSAIAGLFIGAQINFGAPSDAHTNICDKNITKWLHVDMAALALDDGRATGYGSTLLSTLLAAGNIDVNIVNKL